jgi:hypothetical protein
VLRASAEAAPREAAAAAAAPFRPSGLQRRAEERLESELESGVDQDSDHDKDSDHDEDKPRKSQRRGRMIRKSYHLAFKLKVLDMLISCKKELKKGAIARAAVICGVNNSSITKWAQQEESLRSREAKYAGRRGRGFAARVFFRAPRGPEPLFAVAEAEVIAKFDIARGQRQAVKARVLRLWMQVAVKHSYPKHPGAASFTASNGWCVVYFVFLCAAHVPWPPRGWRWRRAPR